MKTFEEIKSIIIKHLGEGVILGELPNGAQPQLIVEANQLMRLCNFLHMDSALYFDMLSNITCIDNGPDKGTMEMVYNLYSIPFNHHLMFKIEFPRGDDQNFPEINSLSSIWRTAEWHEREVFDFFGVKFKGHPDLRRILMPADWESYPLRKDYQQQETYHGIKVAYQKDADG